MLSLVINIHGGGGGGGKDILSWLKGLYFKVAFNIKTSTFMLTHPPNVYIMDQI